MKYDWTNVDKKVKWIATDDDGVANGFESEPKIGECGLWCVDENYECIQLNDEFVDMFVGDWRESLEKRP